MNEQHVALVVHEPSLACDLMTMSEGTIGDALDVRRARLVVIHDVWVGYNRHSPVAAVYELRRSSRGTFSGEGRLSTAIAGVRAIDVTVPSATASRFLSGIADAPIVAGSYTAMQLQTDDYPHIEIAIHVDVRDLVDNSGFVLLFTKSQGEFHAPWGACIGGQTFTLPGEHVGMALPGLRPA